MQIIAGLIIAKPSNCQYCRKVMNAYIQNWQTMNENEFVKNHFCDENEIGQIKIYY